MTLEWMGPSVAAVLLIQHAANGVLMVTTNATLLEHGQICARTARDLLIRRVATLDGHAKIPKCN